MDAIDQAKKESVDKALANILQVAHSPWAESPQGQAALKAVLELVFMDGRMAQQEKRMRDTHGS